MNRARALARHMIVLPPLLLFAAHLWLWPGETGVLNWGEPDYGYLLNSADLRFGLVPGHTDHPGTTVQALGALVMLVSQAVHGSGFRWYEDLLLRPAVYQRWMSLVLVACGAAGLWALGLCVLRRGYGAGLALFLQLLPFLSFNLWYYSPRVGPELLLAGWAAAFVAWFCLHPSQEQREKASFGVVLGALIGFGVATKYNAATALPWLLLAGSKKSVARASACAVLSFFLFTLPMAGVYSASFEWLWLLTKHQGLYGTGGEGVLPSAAAWAQNFQLLWGEDPHLLVLFPVCGLMAAVFAWREKSRFFFVAAVSIAVHFAIVLKHPASRYFLPLLASMMLVLWELFRRLPARTAWLGVLAVLSFLPVQAGRAAVTIRGFAVNEPILASLKQFRADHPSCGWVWISPVPTAEWALSAGNGSAARRHTQTLLSLYPDTTFYEVSPPRFHRFIAVVAPSEIEARHKAAGCLFLGGIHLKGVQEFLRQAPFRYRVAMDEQNGRGAFVLELIDFGAPGEAK